VSEDPRGRAAGNAFDPTEALRRVQAGWFLLRDHGLPFEGNGWKAKDLADSAVRRRGRGLGLEIVHRAMGEVVYHPSSSVGNVTWTRFGTASVDSPEAGHAG
jgi:anti-sigma regulatory factor (Ser/Thr protein kinase)